MPLYWVTVTYTACIRVLAEGVDEQDASQWVSKQEIDYSALTLTAETSTVEPAEQYECAECGTGDHPTSECPHAKNGEYDLDA